MGQNGETIKVLGVRGIERKTDLGWKIDLGYDVIGGSGVVFFHWESDNIAGEIAVNPLNHHLYHREAYPKSSIESQSWIEL